MTAKSEFIDYVPEDPIENVRWRFEMSKAAMKDLELQDALFSAAMEDVFFWFNAFCWCFEPRALVKIRPMVTWTHQDPAILKMEKALTDSERTEQPIDVILDKSRSQGGTWIYLDLFLRRFIRDDMFSAGLVTRNEGLVDSSTDPDTLLWKADWALKMLPFWMLPGGYQRKTADHSIYNPENGSTIVGYSAAADVGRGGRKTVFALDEIGSKDFVRGGADWDVMDSTQHVTNCRFLVSTFGTDSGAFFEAASEHESTNAVHIVLDWKDNPVQNQLSYTTKEGVHVPFDPQDGPVLADYLKSHRADLKKLERRGFPFENHQRSPWYDQQCLRPGATPRSIAKELDRNPRGAVGKVFDTLILDRMRLEKCKPPVWQGKLIYDNETLEILSIIRQENGPLKLWFKPGVDRSVPTGSYVVGCDISAGGTGEYSSNSAACVINEVTGEQAAEYAVMGMMGTKFGRLCVALSKWFHNAYLGWEASGIASPYEREVMEVLYYGNVYFRDVERVGSKKKSRKPGWWNAGDDDKGELFEGMCIAMDDGKFTPRSEDLITECGEYEWEGGKIVHRLSRRYKMDGKAHGDRCVAAGVAWLLCEDRPSRNVDVEGQLRQNAPYGSPAWRHQQASERSIARQTDRNLTLQDLLGFRRGLR